LKNGETDRQIHRKANKHSSLHVPSAVGTLVGQSGTPRQPMKSNGNHKPLNKQALAAACEQLAQVDASLAQVHDKHGTPPLWDRPQGFATLLYIILEQQVSLASAKACFDKLTAAIGTVSVGSLPPPTKTRCLSAPIFT